MMKQKKGLIKSLKKLTNDITEGKAKLGAYTYGKYRLVISLRNITDRERMRYAAFKKKGICVNCHRNLAMPGRVKCEVCLKKHRDIAKKYRERGAFYPLSH